MEEVQRNLWKQTSTPKQQEASLDKSESPKEKDLEVAENIQIEEVH